MQRVSFVGKQATVEEWITEEVTHSVALRLCWLYDLVMVHGRDRHCCEAILPLQELVTPLKLK